VNFSGTMIRMRVIDQVVGCVNVLENAIPTAVKRICVKIARAAQPARIVQKATTELVNARNAAEKMIMTTRYRCVVGRIKNRHLKKQKFARYAIVTRNVILTAKETK